MVKKNKNKLPKVKNFWFTDWRIKHENAKDVEEKKDIVCKYIGPLFDTGLFKYLRAGYEIGEKSGGHHLQGWMQTNKRLRKDTLLNKLKKEGIELDGFTIGICKGSEKDNEIYTSKDGAFVNWGTYIQQGHRSDKELAQLRKIKIKPFKGDIALEENLVKFIELNIARLIINKKILTVEKRMGLHKKRPKVKKCARGNNNPSRLEEIFGKYSKLVTWE